ncbi:MAG: hypothetical protein QOI38_893 [Sphingomonadales bacterium]|nr:hypothetical protein [Sphingomonadales bacterium]
MSVAMAAEAPPLDVEGLGWGELSARGATL